MLTTTTVRCPSLIISLLLSVFTFFLSYLSITLPFKHFFLVLSLTKWVNELRSSQFYTQSRGRYMFATHDQTGSYSILDDLGIFHSQSQILKWCRWQGSNPSCNRQRLILSPLNYSLWVVCLLRTKIYLQHLFKIDI